MPSPASGVDAASSPLQPRRGLARVLKTAGLAAAVVAVTAAAWLGYLAFRTPPVNRLPLPPGMIALDSTDGQALLAESRFVADYEELQVNFVPQARAAYCGVASSVAVLNALRSPDPRVTQQAFFADPIEELRVTFSGMTLAVLDDLLRAHGLETKLYYASDTDAGMFRSIAERNLARADDFLLVNYQRAVLGQGDMGHISPVAAYHAETDRLLILDVAAHKYPPVWVPSDALWAAMNTVDGSSGRSRGFVTMR